MIRKRSLNFIKRDAEKKVNQLYPFAGSNVTINLQPSQMSIEEFYEEREGLEYKVDESGNVEVNENQMKIDDVESEAKLQRVK